MSSVLAKRLSLVLASAVLSSIPASATNAPSNLSAAGASSSQVNLSWTDNSTDEIGFTFAFDTNSGLTNPTYVYAGGVNTTSYLHTGRAPATTYYYKIKAEGNPDSAWTAVTGATTAPSGLTATAPSNSEIDLTWTGNGSNSAVIGYTYALATNASFTGATYHWVAGNGSASAAQTALGTATTYWLKIKAEGTSDALDSPFGAVVTATTTPANLAASVASSSQINLSWTGNASNSNIIGYTIAYATTSTFSGAVYHYVAGAGATSFNCTGLYPGTTYYYKIKAEGTSDPYDSAFTTYITATTGGAAGGGTPVSSHFAGINAWMPPAIGNHPFNGKLQTDPNDPLWTDVQASGAGIMRYGGHGVDQYADPALTATLDQYLGMVDAMRSKGIEPVLQVPVNGGGFSASQAADIVSYVNVTNLRAVRYWVIGNEPDLPGGAYGPSGYTAAQVAGYLMPFASAMKAADPTIKIIGPETAWYDGNILNNLTVCDGSADGVSKFDVTGTDGNGHTYVDILSFHFYPFNGTQTRPDVISKLMATGGFKDNLVALKARLDACNSHHGRTGDNALEMAVTEANVNYSQPSGDGVSGVGAMSFLGGQFWAELMGIAMQQGVDFVTFWSVIEGNGLSYISSDGTTKRPTYYHFQMVAQNFRGSSVAATDNQANVKTFATADVDQIAVLIMNQDQSSSFNYTVRLDTGTVSGANPLKINVDAGVAAEYSDTLATESSVVLIFDTSGALRKKIEYKLHGHADSNLPPATTTY